MRADDGILGAARRHLHLVKAARALPLRQSSAASATKRRMLPLPSQAAASRELGALSSRLSTARRVMHRWAHGRGGGILTINQHHNREGSGLTKSVRGTCTTAAFHRGGLGGSHTTILGLNFTDLTCGLDL